MRTNDLFEAHQRLANYESSFKALEDTSLTQAARAEGTYLSFRLDGIAASNRHLKDQLVNKAFTASLQRSIIDVYNLFRWRVLRGESRNFFVCAFSFSDEVSFVLSRQKNHFGHRVFKLGTMFAGSLSARMTLNLKTLAAREHVAFDARPILLGNDSAIVDYLDYRWLIGYRNASGKVLRLSNVVPEAELYKPEVYTNSRR